MAKFLSGDSAGAEKDIEMADALKPGNSAVILLREKIIEGKLAVKAIVPDVNHANDLTNLGHEAMKKGDGELAYIRYSDAVDAGASRPFSTFNRAMACVIAQDLAGSASLLNSLQIRSGTPMEINILALRAILARLAGDQSDRAAIEALQQAVRLKGDFSFRLSPLSILQAGLLMKLGPERERDLSEIFEVIIKG